MTYQPEDYNEEALEKYLALKDNIDEALWKDIQKRLQGDTESQKNAITDFFSRYNEIPYEANQEIINFIDSNPDIEVLRHLAREDVKTVRLPMSFELNLIYRLRDIDDEELQEILKEKIRELDELSKKIVDTIQKAGKFLVNSWKPLSIKPFNIPTLSKVFSASTASTIDYANILKYEINENKEDLPPEFTDSINSIIEAIKEQNETTQMILKEGVEYQRQIAENTKPKTWPQKIVEWALQSIIRSIVVALGALIISMGSTILTLKYFFNVPLW